MTVVRPSFYPNELASGLFPDDKRASIHDMRRKSVHILSLTACEGREPQTTLWVIMQILLNVKYLVLYKCGWHKRDIPYRSVALTL